MSSTQITRRTLIKRGAISGLAASLAPVLPIFEKQAEAQTVQGGGFKRLMLIYWSGGTAFGNYLPTGTETNWQISMPMKSLEPYKNKMTIYANIRRAQDNAKGSHQAGTSGIWTGARMLGSGTGKWVSHPSIDQIINKEVPQQTDIPVFNLDCMSQDPGNLRGNTTYDMECRPIHGEMDPTRAFDRLFSNGIATPVTNTGGMADPQAGDKLRAQRKSVLDLVRFELQTLAGRLGGQDRKKLDQHLEHIRSAETRLTAPSGAGGGAVAGWTAPTKDSVPKLEYTFANHQNFPKLVPLHFDMAIAALASDRSRLVTVQLNQGNGDIPYRWIGVNTPHHALTHKPDNDPGLGAIQKWYYEQFADLLRKMDSIKEGNGTLLDNTMVVIGNEFVSGTAHDTDPWPVFIAGSGGGAFKPGRFVNFPTPTGGRMGPNAAHETSKEPFATQFLTSVCHFMGARVARVGDPTMGPPGPLVNFGLV